MLQDNKSEKLLIFALVTLYSWRFILKFQSFDFAPLVFYPIVTLCEYILLCCVFFCTLVFRIIAVIVVIIC